MTTQILLFILSFIIVAFGQPAWIPELGLLAAVVGYVPIFYLLTTQKNPRTRFLTGTLWFGLVQFVQLSWFISHPYLYIYALWVFFSFATGAQFGLLAVLFDPNRWRSKWHLLLIPSVWTLMEWLRLFFMSGYTFNPIGLALTGHLLPMQFASLIGVFGLSFWVILTNLLFFRRNYYLWILAAVVPYLFGQMQISLHKEKISKSETVDAVLVQTAFPVEEAMDFCGTEAFLAYVMDEWKLILNITKPELNQPTDLVALPEFVVPFGAYTFVYRYDEVVQAFREIYGEDSISKLPPKRSPYARIHQGNWMVNNAFWLQGIANNFDSSLVVGLEDVEEEEDGTRTYYSAAKLFEAGKELTNDRYAKRVLVPMGEYIPNQFCRDLAASYGITGSFTPGDGPKVWTCGKTEFGVSICYEETFGDLMRENKIEGAGMLVNLTSDAWYPNSRLTKQHMDLARLRTVENGFPLLRSCNTGITGAFDALGQKIALLGEGDPNFEEIAASLRVKVPTYTYWTLYSELGDGLVVGISMLSVLFVLSRRRIL